MFHTPLGLLALAAVPAVVALHLFRRRFRPRRISALFLWGRRDESVRTGRTLERLHRSPSFWCEVLAACALGLALGGPRACGSGEVPHLVLVLDTSASMGARGADGRAFAERALAIARERIERLPRRARVTVVASGPRPELLAGPAALPGRALEGLGAYAATRLGHDLGRPIAFALELAGEGAVVLLTDGLEPPAVELAQDRRAELAQGRRAELAQDRRAELAQGRRAELAQGPAPLPDAVEVVAVGEPVANTALSRVTRRRVPAGEGAAAHDRVLLTVRHFGPAPRRVRGELRAPSAEGGAGAALEVFELDLEPGGRASASIDLAPDAGAVEVVLEGDALALDDRAWLEPDVPRVVRLRSELEPELGHWLGLAPADAAPGTAPRLARALPDVELVPPGAPAHVTIAREAPGQPEEPGEPETWSLVLPRLGAERTAFGGPFLVEHGHPALEGVTLEGCVWSADPDLALPGRALARAGELALISEATRGAGERAARDLWLDLDPRRSSFHRTPDWPILIANLVERRRALLPGPRSANLLAGETYELRGAPPGPLEVVGPGGALEVPGGDPLRVTGLERPGRYRVERDGAPVARFAVHFADPAESDLRGRRGGVRPASGTLATVRSDLGWLEVVLLALAAVLVALDWTVLAGWRRVFGSREAA